MEDCIFCKIVSGEIPSSKVFENESVVAFHDISPVAPLHLLFIPKIHAKDLVEAMEHPGMVQSIFDGVSQYLDENNLKDRAFRFVTNRGSEAGQSVFHLHFHLIGGRGLSWPPG